MHNHENRNTHTVESTTTIANKIQDNTRLELSAPPCPP